MSKLIMLQGLPASGKSTRAKELVDTGNWIRVNRDLIRTMLHFDKFNGRNEGLTVDAEKALVRTFLLAGKSVVVDDTNLNPKNKEMWKVIASECRSSFAVEKIETDYYECITRNIERGKPVHNSVIRNMALQYNLVRKPEKGWVLCDIDGTVADIEHRLHFVNKEPKDWKGFFGAMEEDKPREVVVKLLREYIEQGHGIIFVSARPEQYRDKTEKWLMNNVSEFFFTLLMRRANDKRPDTEVKQDILDTYFTDRSKIFRVIDDRPSVIRMWKSNGLEVIDVGKGIEF